MMISWRSASIICSVTLTLYMWSTSGIIQWNPGSAYLWYFPSLSINPRVVGRTIRIPSRRNAAVSIAIVKYAAIVMCDFYRVFIKVIIG